MQYHNVTAQMAAKTHDCTHFVVAMARHMQLTVI